MYPNDCRHVAYNLVTGEIHLCERGNDLKRLVNRATRLNQSFGCTEHFRNSWRFCHDNGRRWKVEGLPTI